jgi:hypothetical protein
LLAATVMLALGLSQGTAAAVLLDANCPGPPDDSIDVQPDQRLAQTFTAVHTGAVVRAQTEIEKTSSGNDFQLQILAINYATGGPTNALVGPPATIPDSSVPTGDSMLVGNFGPGVEIHGGVRYALAVTRPGGPLFTVLDRDGNPCPGEEWGSNTQTDPFGLLIPSTFDFVYQVIVNPPNDFSGGRQTKRLLHFTVPSHGVLELRDASLLRGGTASKAGKRVKLLKTVAQELGPGGVTIPLRLTKRAKQILQEKGKLKTWPGVTFTPVGGDPKTKLVLVKFPQGK